MPTRNEVISAIALYVNDDGKAFNGAHQLKSIINAHVGPIDKIRKILEMGARLHQHKLLLESIINHVKDDGMETIAQWVEGGLTDLEFELINKAHEAIILLLGDESRLNLFLNKWIKSKDHENELTLNGLFNDTYLSLRDEIFNFDGQLLVNDQGELSSQIRSRLEDGSLTVSEAVRMCDIAKEQFTRFMNGFNDMLSDPSLENTGIRVFENFKEISESEIDKNVSSFSENIEKIKQEINEYAPSKPRPR